MATNVTAAATSVDQLNAGSRRMVMPSVRMVRIVVNRLARAMRKAIDITARLMIHRLVASLAPPLGAAIAVEVTMEPPLTGPTMKAATNMPPPTR